MALVAGGFTAFFPIPGTHAAVRALLPLGPVRLLVPAADRRLVRRDAAQVRRRRRARADRPPRRHQHPPRADADEAPRRPARTTSRPASTARSLVLVAARRGAVLAGGQAGDDRVVGAEDHRVLRLDRGLGRLDDHQRGVAGQGRQRRQAARHRRRARRRRRRQRGAGRRRRARSTSAARWGWTFTYHNDPAKTEARAPRARAWPRAATSATSTTTATCGCRTGGST